MELDSSRRVADRREGLECATEETVVPGVMAIVEWSLGGAECNGTGTCAASVDCHTQDNRVGCS